ncbi:MAG: outer membrane protein assembly factor BamB family protein [Planctomycetota bacterium]
MLRTAFCACILCGSLCALSFAGENWPCFRGSTGGVAEDKAVPESWSASENVLWKVDIPGKGWSSPIVWGDKIFLTTAVAEGDVQAPRKGLYLGGDREKASEKVHRWMVYCLDWNDGKILWKKTAHEGKPAEPVHIKNTYASETPVTDGERLFCYFGNVGVFCFDMNGEERWKKMFDPVKTRSNWGTASSPVFHEGRVYVVNDNEEESFLVGLDAETGKEIFRVDRDEKSNWATPFIWKNAKRTEVVTCGRKKVRAYDLDGKILWELGPMSSIVIPTPVANDDLLFVTSGFVVDRKCRPIYAVRPGATGDISPVEEEDPSPFLAWHHRFGGPYNPSAIVYKDYFYVLYDLGKLACYNAKTGEMVYSPVRLARDARAFTASPWASHGKIYCLSEDGDTFVVKAGKTFTLLGRNALGEMCMATPAALRGSILLRTLTKIYRIG